MIASPVNINLAMVRIVVSFRQMLSAKLNAERDLMVLAPSGNWLVGSAIQSRRHRLLGGLLMSGHDNPAPTTLNTTP
jgi:hypothetical protein